MESVQYLNGIRSVLKCFERRKHSQIFNKTHHYWQRYFYLYCNWASGVCFLKLNVGHSKNAMSNSTMTVCYTVVGFCYNKSAKSKLNLFEEA